MDPIRPNILEKENCMAASTKAVPKTFHSGTLLMYNVRVHIRIQLRELSVYRSLTLNRYIYIHVLVYRPLGAWVVVIAAWGSVVAAWVDVATAWVDVPTACVDGMADWVAVTVSWVDEDKWWSIIFKRIIRFKFNVWCWICKKGAIKWKKVEIFCIQIKKHHLYKYI